MIIHGQYGSIIELDKRHGFQGIKIGSEIPKYFVVQKIESTNLSKDVYKLISEKYTAIGKNIKEIQLWTTKNSKVIDGIFIELGFYDSSIRGILIELYGLPNQTICKGNNEGETYFWEGKNIKLILDEFYKQKTIGLLYVKKTESKMDTTLIYTKYRNDF